MLKDQFHGLWSKGCSDLEIATASGCSVTTVCRWRLDQGMPPNTRRKSLSSETKDLILRLAEEGKTIPEMAGKTGEFSETIRKFLLRKKVPFRKATRRQMTRKSYGTIGGSGYVELRVAKDGPYANLINHGHSKWTGYAPLHRMRMQDMLGRNLLPEEVVHHIDFDIYNNAESNLMLFPSSAAHLAYHRKLRAEGKEPCRLPVGYRLDANLSGSRIDETE